MKLSRALIPDLAVLQAFEAAARHENFTKAAAELSLTQSAISRQIQTLEDQLGVLLFERVRKRVLLSAAGRNILPDARRLLMQSEELVIRARAAADGNEVLSVATLPTFGNRWLMPRLPGFMQLHPGLVVNISSRGRPFDLARENVDLAIHYGQPVWAHAICTYLCAEMVVPVAAPQLVAATRGTNTDTDIEDMTRLPLLHLATRPRQWPQWFQLQELDPELAYRGSRFDQFSLVIEAALHGMGVALLPHYLIEDELLSGQLNIVFDRPMSTENSYYVVLPEARQDNPIARAFQHWMIGQVRR